MTELAQITWWAIAVIVVIAVAIWDNYHPFGICHEWMLVFAIIWLSVYIYL